MLGDRGQVIAWYFIFMNIYIFQWLSPVGGADTRLIDLIDLLREKHTITLIPNVDDQLQQPHWSSFLKSRNIKSCLWGGLPTRLDGVALSFCNFMLFDEEWRIEKIKKLGLRFVWSNDMMYHTDHELRAVKNGQIDAVLYTSQFHKDVLSKGFKEQFHVKEYIIENYINRDLHWFFLRDTNNFTIGKLSRADFTKYSDGFPMFYESVAPDSKYCVMGWNENLTKKYSWHSFDQRWSLLNENYISSGEFLRRLNLFVYDCSHIFVENQSRAILEAQLTGLPILAPKKWNFTNMIHHGRDGFLWENFEECRRFYRMIRDNKDLYHELSVYSADLARKSVYTNKQYHLDSWRKILNGD